MIEVVTWSIAYLLLWTVLGPFLIMIFFDENNRMSCREEIFFTFICGPLSWIGSLIS